MQYPVCQILNENNAHEQHESSHHLECSLFLFNVESRRAAKNTEKAFHLKLETSE